MNIMCKIFGHKFINKIYQGAWYSEIIDVSTTNGLFCKRCGIGLNKLNSLIGKKK